MKTKRLLSLIISLAMLLFAGCTPAPEAEDTATAENSSGTAAADSVKWLADRLSTFAEGEVVTDGESITYEGVTLLLTCGDDNGLGIDLSGFRDEGYIVKGEGAATIIAAKTAESLDSAVRWYAAEAESSGDRQPERTYGLKVGALTIGGADIADFSILLPRAAEGDTTFAASATIAMETAARELTKYIRLTTGITLPTVYVVGLHTMTDEEIRAEHGAAVVLLSDPTAKTGSSLEGEVGEMGTESYRITVTDGLMRILGGNQRGCVYGVYDFLEQYIGWRFLGDNVEYLYDAERIDIEEMDVSYTPSFSYRATTYPSVTDSNNFPKQKQNCFNTTRYAHSPEYGYGFGSTFYHAHTFSYQVAPGTQGSDPYGDQPCLTDPDTKQTIINSMLALIEERLGPPFNTRIGYDTVQIGCSMNDNTNFCKCFNCMGVVRGLSFSDLYLGFVNDAAAVIAEEYPGVIVNTAIYFLARKPPVATVPADNVSIYYCVQGCNQHTICGGECEGYSTTLGTENVTEKAQLEAWSEICDRIYVWHYSSSFFSTLSPCPNVYELYDDVTYCASLDGVVGFYGEGNYSNNFENLKAYIFCRLMWNADITEEEFYRMIDEYITIFYGEKSAPYIREYLHMHQVSGDAIDGCFITNYHYPFDMMSDEYYRDNYETMKELFDMAVRFAKDAETEKRIEMLRLHMEFTGLSATYERDYVNGSEETRMEFKRAYKWLVDSINKYDLEPGRFGTYPESYELEDDISENPMLIFFHEIIMLSKEGRA